MKKDYLKFWRVVRYWVKAKYSISTGELDMLLFLYSESYFGKDKFDEFDELLGWNVNRFDKLLRDDWIVVWRKRQGKQKTLYALSMKAKRMIAEIYKRLEGEEISENKQHNPLFLANVPYNHKVYRNFIKKMNQFIRQQQRHAQE